MKLPGDLTRRDVVKVILESILIIFSVLLALFLNEYRGQVRDDKVKDSALLTKKP